VSDTDANTDRERAEPTDSGAEVGSETEAETRSAAEPAEETDPEDAADIDDEAETLDEERDEAAEEAREQVRRTPTPVGESTLIAKTVVRIVTPLILLTAVALLLQGHNLPGGGFIAGVLTAAAFALLYVVYGLEYVETELLGAFPTIDEFAIGPAIVSEYRRMFAGGLALAAGAGVVAMGFDLAFLSQSVVFLDLPIYHELELASAFVFDLGVYLVVVGALLTIVAVVGAE
jgi:multicomponent Na+:H+ antiporter subunit B